MSHFQHFFLRTPTRLGALSLHIPYCGLILNSFDLPDVLHLLHQFTSLAHLRLRNMNQLSLRNPPPQYPSSPSYRFIEFGWTNSLADLSENPRDRFGYISNWLVGNSSEGPSIFALAVGDDVESEILPSFLKQHGERLIGNMKSATDEQGRLVPIELELTVE
ncbi:hypothetical protein FRC03_007859 [Tulasnella sp. 419]|nr:hypothetical protein FRC03_007859 [Tulasnella sp. 419]